MLDKPTKLLAKYFADTRDNLLWFLHIHKRDIKDLAYSLKAKAPKYINDTKLNLAWYCAVRTEQTRFNLAQFSRGLEQKLKDPVTLSFLHPVITRLNNFVDREIFLNTRCLENARVAFRPALAYQGIAVFTLTLAVLFTTASVFTPKPQLAQNTVINPAHSKSVQTIVAGRKVTWSVQVPKSEITQDKYLLQLPKEARNVKIQPIQGREQKFLFPTDGLTLHDRKQLAGMWSLDTTGIDFTRTQTAGLAEVKEFVFRFLHSLTQYFAADLEHAADSAIAQIADKLNDKVKETKDSKLVDLSSVSSASLPAGRQGEIAASPSAPRNDGAGTGSNDISSLREPRLAGDEAIPASANEIASVSPRNDGIVSNDVAELEAKIYTLEASDDEVITVTYETDGPQITEEETSTGKLVTVSSPSDSSVLSPTSHEASGSNDVATGSNDVAELEARSYNLEAITPEFTDVLAYTTIPEIYKVGQEAKIKIKWLNPSTSSGQAIAGEQAMSFTAFDLNNNGKLDYIEWTVPHLSEQVFEIIFISKAWLLDSNLEIQEDIYDKVATQEGTWAENTYSTVNANEYVRVTFEQILNNTKDITVVAKPSSNDGTGSGDVIASEPAGDEAISIEVYPVYENEDGELIQGEKLELVNDGIHLDFSEITHEDTYRILLTNLETPTDVFDLKIVGCPTPNNCALDIDYIVDPTYTWTERRPAGDADKSWKTVASDADGSHLIAAVYSGRLYTSSDSGATWTERQPAGAEDKNWRSVASDADGSHLIAAVYSGRLYTSSDSGATWTERRPAGDANSYWYGVASDADGSNLIAAVKEGRLYKSSDYGVTWNETQPVGDWDASWVSVASDSDGSNLFAGMSNYRIYTSADSGATWTERRPVGEVSSAWYAIGSDYDGSNLIAGVSNGRLYTSADSGATWTERRPAGDANKLWRTVASDSDGSTLVAGIGDFLATGRLYISYDSGITWAEVQPAGDADKSWLSVASDSDGSNLIAVVSGGRLYTSSSPWACGQDITDSRDSQVYSTVQIGDQCWTRENMNVGTRIDGAGNQTDNATLEKYCYANSDANCDTYGGLYQWDETMQYTASCNGTGAPPDDACATPVQGICPTGWHIPSHYELTTLERAVCTSGTCATDFPYDTETTGELGTDEGTTLKTVDTSNFSGLLTGSRLSNGSFNYISTRTYYWSSLETEPIFGTVYAWYRNLDSTNATIENNYAGKTIGYSVRCIQDAVPAGPSTLYWVGGTGNWSDDDNHWATTSGGSAGDGNIPATGDNVVFDASSGTGTVTIDAASVSVADLTASSNNITIATSTNGITVTGAMTVTVTISGTAAVTFSGGTITSGDTSVTISAPLTLAADTTVFADTGGTTTISGIIDDSGASYSLSKTGAGTLTLSGNNADFAGGVTIKAGTVFLSSHANNAGSGIITIGDGATNANATLKGYTHTYANPITVASVSSGALTLEGSGSGGTSSVFSGAITLIDDLVLTSTGGVSLYVSGGITGTGNITLNSTTDAQTVLNTTVINNTGTITNASVSSGSALISAAIGANVTGLIQNSATSKMILYGDKSSFAGAVTIKAGTLSGYDSNSAYGTGTITIGDTSGSANATLQVGESGVGYLTLSNAITVASGSSGTLSITTLSTNNTVSGAITLNNNLTITNNYSAVFTISSAISGTGNITTSAASSGGITLSNASINPTGTITNSGDSTGTTTISGVIGANVTGVIQNSATSQLTLSGNNADFAGGVTIKSGTVQLKTSTNAAGTGTITIGDTSGSADARLWGAVFGTITNPIAVASGSSGTLSINRPNHVDSYATVIFSGAITLNNNLTIGNTNDSAYLTTISGGITGTGNIILSTGLSAPLTISTTSINHTGTITNSGTGAAATTISAVIGANVTGVVQNSATSALTLSNASNTFTGDVTISAGTLNVTQNNTFDTLTIAGDATFNPTNAKTITLTDLVSTGSAGHLAIIKSASAGNAASLTTASSQILTDYLSVTDSTPVEENTWFAGANGSLVSNTGYWQLEPDNTPPAPSSFSPINNSAITDATQTITFTTNENADCRLSLLDDSYDLMSDDVDCTGDGTTSQSCTTADLGSAGSKTVYIACQDTAGNKDTAETNEALTYHLISGATGTVRYWIAMSEQDWSSATGCGGTTCWSTTSGGSGGASVPTTTDDAIFDANRPGNCNINTTASVKGMYLAGYTGTISQGSNAITIGSDGFYQATGTFTGSATGSTIDINGTFTLSGGTFTATSGTMTVAGNWTSNSGSPTFSTNAGTITFDTASTSTITPGSVIFNHVNINHTYDTVISGTMDINGNFVFQNSNNGAEIDGGTINLAGNLTVSGGMVNGYSNVTINIDGAGDQTYDQTDTDGMMGHIVINKASGTFSLGSTQSLRVCGNWTHTQGAVNAGSSTVIFNTCDLNSTIDASGMSFNDVIISKGNHATNITGTMNVLGDFSRPAESSSQNGVNGGTINIGGNLTYNTGGVAGTASITLNGSGDQTITTGASAVYPSGVFTINKASGTAILASSFTVNSAGQDLAITQGTLDLAGYDLTVNDQFTIGASGVLALTGDETINKQPTSITAGAIIEYNASSGSHNILDWTYDSLIMKISSLGTTIVNASKTVAGFILGPGAVAQITSGQTLTVSGNFTSTATSGSHATLSATTPSSVAYMPVSGSATVNYVEGTDIDSTGGTEINNTTGGASTRCVNWHEFNTAPSAPALVSPTNASFTADTTPALSANYSDPDTGDVGTTNYGIATSAENCLAETFVSGCGGTCSGTSAETADENENTTWTPTSSIGTDATYYWCSQNNDGTTTSSWTQMGSFSIDTTAPATLATAQAGTGVYTFGETSTVAATVTLTCADPSAGSGQAGSGCLTTLYCIDYSSTGSEPSACTPETAYTEPVAISTTGTSYIRYFSTDSALNAETVASQTIVISSSSSSSSSSAGSGAYNLMLENPVSQLINQVNNMAKQASEIASLLTPFAPRNDGESELGDLPPVEVPDEAPPAMAGKWPALSPKQMEKIAILPLPETVKEFALKFPGFAETLEKVGINQPDDVNKLKAVQLSFPGLSGSVGLEKNVPFSEFTFEQKNRMPNNVVFASLGDKNIDLNISLRIADAKNAVQSIRTIENKPLYLTVKPESDAKSVKGYLVFKSASSKSAAKDFAGIFPAALAEAVMDASLLPPEKQMELALLQFNYEDADGDGIFTAEINAPSVSGEFEIRTVIAYDKIASPSARNDETLSLILLVDPEGYIFEKMQNREIRVEGAVVSIYWLNPSAGSGQVPQWELWPAQKYQQQNPQTTDKTGKYSFLVPEGNYYLQVEAPEYIFYKGEPFLVQEGGGVHQNIELKLKSPWARIFTIERILLGAVIILLILIFIVLLKTKFRK